MTAASANRRHATRARRRTIAIKPVQNLEAQINVTPLIDVVLVLLIVFMVLTPIAEQNLTVQLASTQRAKVPPSVKPSQIVVELKGDARLVNAVSVSRADYLGHLRMLLGGQVGEDRLVFVVASDEVPYLTLIDAIDSAKQAGATTVGLALGTEP